MEGASSKSYPLSTLQRVTDTEGTNAFALWSWLMENISGLHCVFPPAKEDHGKVILLVKFNLDLKSAKKEKASRLAEAVAETGSRTSH